MLNEIEADAADAAGVQLREVAVREAVVDVRDAAIAAAALRDRVQDHRVVDAVAARVDEHRARQTQRLLELDEALERRVGRRVAAIGRVWILVAGPEDVAMRVAGVARRTVLRHPRVRIGRHANRNLSQAASPTDRASPWPA